MTKASAGIKNLEICGGGVSGEDIITHYKALLFGLLIFGKTKGRGGGRELSGVFGGRPIEGLSWPFWGTGLS